MALDYTKLAVMAQALGYKIFMYPTNDAFATVLADGYFDGADGYVTLNAGDIIICNLDLDGTDDLVMLLVTVGGSDVTVIPLHGFKQELSDPGDAGALPVTRSATVAITTGGAETRTLAIPAVPGIELTLSLDVDGGDCVITAAAAVNQTGNNTLTMADAGDEITLRAVRKAAALVWRVVSNDGVALSTV